MELPVFLFTALIATALFTLVGLSITWVQNEDIIEPILLKKFLLNLGACDYGACEKTLAFAIRYSVSLVFIFLYEFIDPKIYYGILPPKVLLMNVMCGILGIVVMRLVCSLLMRVPSLYRSGQADKSISNAQQEVFSHY